MDFAICRNWEFLATRTTPTRPCMCWLEAATYPTGQSEGILYDVYSPDNLLPREDDLAASSE